MSRNDRQQFAGFCRESVPGADLEEVMAAVAAARGVGKRTLDNIRECVEQLFRKDEGNE